MNRDDFPQKIKDAVAKRAAFMCSNPDCKDITVRSHSDPEKSSNNGVAAHICAAAPGGPRYDPQQTPEERSSINNAIWLCHSCSDIVDKDAKKYTEEVLHEWKKLHEEFIIHKRWIPSLPDIRLNTLDGFTIPTLGDIKITGEYCRLCREHTLIILNQNEKMLHDIRLRIQFPEIIIHTAFKKPIGTNIICMPDRVESIAKASGGGSVTVTKTSLSCENYIIEMDKLLPRNSIEVKLLSIEKDKRLLEISDKIEKVTKNFEEYPHFYVLGSFQYEWQDAYFERKFLVLLSYDRERRLISSVPCEEFVEGRKLCYSYVA